MSSRFSWEGFDPSFLKSIILATDEEPNKERYRRSDDKDVLVARVKRICSAPVTAEALDRALLAVLRDCTAADFVRYADVSEGLENRLVRAIREQGSFAAAVDAAVSKRYPRARIRRACWRAFLRIHAAWEKEEPPFIRVLGLKPDGAALLRSARLPVLTKPAHIAELSPRAQAWFAADERAGDLYALAYPAEAERTAGQERRYTPVFLEG